MKHRKYYHTHHFPTLPSTFYFSHTMGSTFSKPTLDDVEIESAAQFISVSPVSVLGTHADDKDAPVDIKDKTAVVDAGGALNYYPYGIKTASALSGSLRKALGINTLPLHVMWGVGPTSAARHAYPLKEKTTHAVVIHALSHDFGATGILKDILNPRNYARLVWNAIWPARWGRILDPRHWLALLRCSTRHQAIQIQRERYTAILNAVGNENPVEEIMMASLSAGKYAGGFRKHMAEINILACAMAIADQSRLTSWNTLVTFGSYTNQESTALATALSKYKQEAPLPRAGAPTTFLLAAGEKK